MVNPNYKWCSVLHNEAEKICEHMSEQQDTIRDQAEHIAALEAEVDRLVDTVAGAPDPVPPANREPPADPDPQPEEAGADAKTDWSMARLADLEKLGDRMVGRINDAANIARNRHEQLAERVAVLEGTVAELARAATEATAGDTPECVKCGGWRDKHAPGVKDFMMCIHCYQAAQRAAQNESETQ